MPKSKVDTAQNDVALAKIQAETEQHRITVNGNLVAQAIRWGGIVAFSICCVLGIMLLAGHNTTANITVNLLARFYIPWLGTALGVVYGKGQEKAKHDQIQRDSKRITELEKLIDANRTSSNLTERGLTRPEDKI